VTNQTQSTDPNDQNVVEFGDSPGRRLRVQRQSRGLAIERIATQLHLRPEVIEALEQDRFDLLPDPVFITGYLRNYSRALGLDPAPLIAAYQSHAGGTDAVAPTRRLSDSGSHLDSGGTRILVRLVSLGLAAAVIAVIALWWQDRPEVAPELETETAELEPDPIASDPASESVDEIASGADTETPRAATESADRTRAASPEASEPPPADPPETTERQTPAALASSASEPGGEPTSEAGPRAIPESTASPALDPPTPAQTDTPDQRPSDPQVATTVPAPSASAAAAKGIVLEFTGPSWLEVRDAAGERLIFGEMKAGERREVAGQGPFRFTVGRVNNSTMTVDGEPFDLEARSRGNVARFSLDPESPE
jgi:cytoskeleton protein RodZ